MYEMNARECHLILMKKRSLKICCMTGLTITYFSCLYITAILPSASKLDLNRSANELDLSTRKINFGWSVENLDTRLHVDITLPCIRKVPWNHGMGEEVDVEMVNEINVIEALCRYNFSDSVIPLSLIYSFLMHIQPTNASDNRIKSEVPVGGCKRLQVSRRIVIAVLFNVEVDSLEIALTEYDGVADVVLFENRRIHNVHEKRQKPVLWPLLRRQKRFTRFKNVRFKECVFNETRYNTSMMWEVENSNIDCIESYLQSAKQDYNIIINAHVDEVLSRGNLLVLKHCAREIKLPTSAAIAMPMGRLYRSFRTDFHHPDYPSSLSMPAIFAGGNAYNGTFRRKLFEQTRPIVGGMHLNNYCYLPYLIIKCATATEQTKNCTLDNYCARMLAEIIQACYDRLAIRVRANYGPEHEVPVLLKEHPDKFLSWYGRIDTRDVLLYNLMCSNFTRQTKLSYQTGTWQRRQGKAVVPRPMIF